MRTPSDSALCHTWPYQNYRLEEQFMANNQVQHPGAQAPQTSAQPQDASTPPPPGSTQAQQGDQQPEDFDGLEGKKPEELTPEELRLMADTMPGEGPGD